MRPTKAHFLRVTAEQESANAVETMAGLSGYEVACLTLQRHLTNLKQLQSTELKVEYKRKHIHELLPWVEGALSVGNGLPDKVIERIAVWATDIGDYDLMFRLAEYLLHHDLTLPESIARTPATFFAEELATAAEKARKAGKPFDLAVLDRVHALTEAQDMVDEVRAKLYRERGYLNAEHDIPTTIAQFERALELDINVGVKQQLDKYRKLWEKQTKQAEDDTNLQKTAES